VKRTSAWGSYRRPPRLSYRGGPRPNNLRRHMSNFFDPKTFAAGGFLDGQIADITEITATKFDYNGTVDPPANVIEITVTRADGKTRTEVYGTGQAEPTEMVTT